MDLSLKEGGKGGKVIVGLAAVLNIIVLCVAFALVSRSLDERELKGPIASTLVRQLFFSSSHLFYLYSFP